MVICFTLTGLLVKDSTGAGKFWQPRPATKVVLVNLQASEAKKPVRLMPLDWARAAVARARTVGSY